MPPPPDDPDPGPIPDWYLLGLAFAQEQARKDALGRGDVEAAADHARNELRALAAASTSDDPDVLPQVEHAIGKLRLVAGDFDAGFATCRDGLDGMDDRGAPFLRDIAIDAERMQQPQGAARAALEAMCRARLTGDTEVSRSAASVLRRVARTSPLAVRELLDTELDGAGGLHDTVRELRDAVLRKPAVSGHLEEFLLDVADLEMARAAAAYAMDDPEGERAARGRADEVYRDPLFGGSDNHRFPGIFLDDVHRALSEGGVAAAELERLSDDGSGTVEQVVRRLGLRLIEAASAHPDAFENGIVAALEAREAVAKRLALIYEHEAVGALAPDADDAAVERVRSSAAEQATMRAASLYFAGLETALGVARRDVADRFIEHGDMAAHAASPRELHKWALRVAIVDRAPDGKYGRHAERSVVRALVAISGNRDSARTQDVRDLFRTVMASAGSKDGLTGALEEITKLQTNDELLGYHRAHSWDLVRAEAHAAAAMSATTPEERSRHRRAEAAACLRTGYPEPSDHAHRVLSSRHRLTELLSDPEARAVVVDEVVAHVVRSESWAVPEGAPADALEMRAEVVALYDEAIADYPKEDVLVDPGEVHDTLRQQYRQHIASEAMDGQRDLGSATQSAVTALFGRGLSDDGLALAHEYLESLQPGTPEHDIELRRTSALAAIGRLTHGDVTSAADAVRVIEQGGIDDCRFVLARAMGLSPAGDALVEALPEPDGAPVDPLFLGDATLTEADLAMLTGFLDDPLTETLSPPTTPDASLDDPGLGTDAGGRRSVDESWLTSYDGTSSIDDVLGRPPDQGPEIEGPEIEGPDEGLSPL